MIKSFPIWFPKKPPLYDINKTYIENALYGPFFHGEIPKRIFPKEETWIDFLGFKIASPIGIPAGPLLTANWIALCATLGFDVLTYKTIRSKEHPAHPLPNMVFVKSGKKLGKKVYTSEDPPQDIDALAVTNSFGMPSKSPEFLKEDIPRACAALKPGQVMIVSVVGTHREEIDFSQDFVQTALLAKEAGAQLIEANFSCPNISKKEGSLYLSADAVYEMTQAIVRAIAPTPLILKMGTFAHREEMRPVLVAAARAGARAICGINTLSRQVFNQKNEPALGMSRLISGICGSPIRKEALRFLKDAATINKEEKLELTLMGCGGITSFDQFQQFLEAGATVALTATGMMWDPYLAMRYQESIK
jgi:dihydroorotate dehydrogenase